MPSPHTQDPSIDTTLLESIAHLRPPFTRRKEKHEGRQALWALSLMRFDLGHLASSGVRS